jgi:hypothetical protein
MLKPGVTLAPAIGCAAAYLSQSYRLNRQSYRIILLIRETTPHESWRQPRVTPVCDEVATKLAKWTVTAFVRFKG